MMKVTLLKDYKLTAKTTLKKGSTYAVSRGVHKILVDGNFIKESKFGESKTPEKKENTK